MKPFNSNLSFFSENVFRGCNCPTGSPIVFSSKFLDFYYFYWGFHKLRLQFHLKSMLVF